MTGWSGFLAVLGRLVLVAAILAALLSTLFVRFRPRRERSRREASPQRRGPAELARLLERSRDRPFSRDQVLERLRALARDAVALGRGMDEAAARSAIEEGSWSADRELLLFLGEDQLATKGRDEDFLLRTEQALEAIEKVATGADGGRG